MVALNVILAQCINAVSTGRLTAHSAHDYWGADGIVWSGFFGERTPQSIYLIGDTVHILWTRAGGGDRYNRSRDRGSTWDYCSGSDCGGITVLSYGWESSIVVGGSKVHAVAYCWNCSGTSWVPYNRSLDGGTTWDYPTSGQTIFHSSEYGYHLLDAPSMDVSLNGDTVLLVIDGYHPSYGLRLKRTFDGGNTWGPYGGIVVAYPSSAPEAHPQIAYNKMGKWFVCYTDFPYIKVTYSTDYGNTWSTPVNLDTLVTNLSYNSCHVSAHGNHVAVVWFDKKGNAVNVYFRESTDGGITWRSKVNLTGLTASGDTAAGATVSVQGDRVYVTWFEKSNRALGGNFEIFVGCKPHPDSSWLPVQRVSYTSGRSLWPMVAYHWSGPTSYGIVCWQDNTPGNYEIYCTTFIPLADDGELDVEEAKVEEEKPFEVVGRTVILKGNYSIYDVSGRLLGRGGKVSLKGGIYFVEAGGKL
ncbi:MAG: sialidase family protein, partial [Candidatus Caldipriscus sp.]|nr:sialidase family protein [Candidatus Caldipriscus sp.]